MCKTLKKMGATNIALVDRKGVLNKNRKDLNQYNQDLAVDTKVIHLMNALLMRMYLLVFLEPIF